VLAYAIGLMATDGCIADGDHVSFPSADRELVELFGRSLAKANRISEFRTETGGTAYRIQFGDVAFCRWLEGIGIKARRSLTIGALSVPDHLTLDIARGLLDGDGSIINKRTRADTGDGRITTGSISRRSSCAPAGLISTGSARVSAPRSVSTGS